MEQKGTCQNHYQIRLSFGQIQRRCFPVNHALSFSHHPKSFGVIFEGNPTEWQPNLFQRSKYSSISTAVSQLQLLQRAACILPRWWLLAQLHAGHTHSSLLLCLGCIQSHDCKHLTIVTWKKSTSIHCQWQICCKVREMGRDNPWWCHLVGMTQRELVPSPAGFPPGFCGCRHWGVG